MPKFNVVGAFRVRDRLVVYGDIIEGVVRIGDDIRIPLNSSFAMTARIHSVEAVDETPTGSHVALVIEENDPLEIQMLEALNLVGETLAVGPPSA